MGKDWVNYLGLLFFPFQFTDGLRCDLINKLPSPIEENKLLFLPQIPECPLIQLPLHPISMHAAHLRSSEQLVWLGRMVFAKPQPLFHRDTYRMTVPHRNCNSLHRVLPFKTAPPSASGVKTMLLQG